MNQLLINSLLATTFVSLLSLVGIVTIFIRHTLLAKISLYLVAFSAGALVGGAFLHLIPEMPAELNSYIYIIVGLSIFFVLERYLKWHHCHEDGECEVHTFTYMSLVGDSLHNFIDGLVMVSAFSVNPSLGVATVIAVAAHELPQELGDFGILIHGGFSRTKALMWNFGTSITAIMGALIGYFMISYFDDITSVLLPLAAGGFIYIAMSDLVPELHKEPRLSKSIVNFGFFALGIILMLAIKLYFGE